MYLSLSSSVHTQIKNIYIYTVLQCVWKNSSSYFPTLLGITQLFSLLGRAAVFYSFL